MKTTQWMSLLTLSVGIGQLTASDGYTNVIEMIELGAGDDAPLLWNMPGTIAAEGNDVLVGEPVPEAGALFILSTIQDEPFRDWFLAQTAVGAYLPKATINIVTHDKDSKTPRTRADQPFQVNATVSGLFNANVGVLDLPAEVIQQAASEVRLQSFAESYAPGVSELPGGKITSSPVRELSLSGNGDFPQNPGELQYYTSLNPSNPTQARGEEHFVIRSLDDGGVEGGALDQAELKVWPVWSGTMTGLDDPEFLPYSYGQVIEANPALSNDVVTPAEGFVFADGTTFEELVEESRRDHADGEVSTLVEDRDYFEGTPPEMTFNWNDLYPSSTVGIIINDASKPYPWGGRWIGGTQRVFTEDVSHDYSDVVTKWGDVIGGPGVYAVWMVTFTPGIGWEVGGQDVNGVFREGGWIVPIVENKIMFRGSLQSLN